MNDADPGAGDRVFALCDAQWAGRQHSCTGFVKAVADRMGVGLTGTADAIHGQLRRRWTALPDGRAAAAAAAEGRFVLGALPAGPEDGSGQGPRQGHVVVVVHGPLEQDAYPTAFWGQAGDRPAGRARSITACWDESERDRVDYFAAPF